MLRSGISVERGESFRVKFMRERLDRIERIGRLGEAFADTFERAGDAAVGFHCHVGLRVGVALVSRLANPFCPLGIVLAQLFISFRSGGFGKIL